jgi:hypothetical protein
MTTIHTGSLRRRTRLAAAAIAGIAFGIGGALAAVSAAPDDHTVKACPASEADLLRAADAGRRLEAIDPTAFDVSPRPADHHDLRLAAEWARRVAILAPHTIPEHCGS